ncbi:TetR/AcrR family transcriptional regulator [Chitinophaga lutea]|nr:TetR/AcrR family transcriptional regulator [Chitinophaga lutea]
MTQTLNTTEQQIIAAARKIFMHRGLAGARMQDIADEAGINKAMLHYYYRSKEKLFEIVFGEAIDQLLIKVNNVLAEKMPVEQKLATVVDYYITNLSENPYLPMFVLNEIQQNPDRMVQRFMHAPLFPNIQVFIGEIGTAMENGTFRKVNPAQLMVSIISMCIFPFVARPLLQAAFTVNDMQFGMMMQERKKFVTDFVMHALRP